jgi:hypothetical protein
VDIANDPVAVHDALTSLHPPRIDTPPGTAHRAGPTAPPPRTPTGCSRSSTAGASRAGRSGCGPSSRSSARSGAVRR